MRLALPLATIVLLAAPFAAPLAAQATPPAASQGASQATTQPAHAETGSPEQDHPRARRYLSLDQRFQMANTTHDGHLTPDQARAASVMHVVSSNFEAIDKDHKGFVTEDDIRDWYKSRRAARRHEATETQAKS